MKKAFLFVVPFLSLFGALLAADPDESENPQLPTGPLPVRASDFASWKITYIYDAPAPTAPGAKSAPDAAPPPVAVRLAEVSVIKTGTTYHQRDTSTNGDILDKWWVNGMPLTGRNGKGPYLLGIGNDSAAPGVGYNSSDFPDLDWIGADCYTGVEAVAGVRCFVFKKQISPYSKLELLAMSLTGHEGPKILVDATAWIDLKTLLPVQKSMPGQHAMYAFLPPPSTPLTLPPEAAKQLKAWQIHSEEAHRRPPPP